MRIHGGLDRDGERGNVERGLEAFDRVVGVRRPGYRSTAWDVSEHTVDLLLGLGFAYDSSCMCDDLHPTTCEPGLVDRAVRLRGPVDVVEVPVTWGLDDFPPFAFELGTNAGLASPSAVEESGVVTSTTPTGRRRARRTRTMHPQVIGRGYRMLMLERLVTQIAAHGGAVFETIGDHVDRWRAARP